MVVGEVWLCSGQSNMQYTARNSLGFAEDSKKTSPLLRQFQVAIDGKPDPQDDCKGSWVVASPETVGLFTGVGYFFGKRLQDTLQVPVGLIFAAVPGTPLEVWASAEGFAKVPDWNTSKVARLKKYNDYPGQLQDFVTAYQALVGQERTRRQAPGSGDVRRTRCHDRRLETGDIAGKDR